MSARQCITCFQRKPLSEFYAGGKGTIMRDCNWCRSDVTVLLPPMTDAQQRRAAREAAAPGRCTDEQRQARWDYYLGKCWMCGSKAAVMDHVKPLARGGCAWPSNLRPACWRCNTRKAAMWPLPAWIQKVA